MSAPFIPSSVGEWCLVAEGTDWGVALDGDSIEADPKLAPLMSANT